MRSRSAFRRHRGVRLLWFGETTRTLGTRINNVVLPLVALQVLHSSAFVVSAITARVDAVAPVRTRRRPVRRPAQEASAHDRQRRVVRPPLREHPYRCGSASAANVAGPGAAGLLTNAVGYGTMPLGALLGGILATVVGLYDGLWIMTALLPLTAAFLLASPLRSLRVLPHQPAHDQMARSVASKYDAEGRSGRTGQNSFVGERRWP